MRTILGLIIIGLFAYLGATLYRIGRLPAVVRSLIASGIVFFLIGHLMGPLATGLLDFEATQELHVLVNLALGWVGLLFGLQFRFHTLRKLPVRRYLGAATESLTTFAVIAAGIWIGVWLTPRAWPIWLTTMVLAVIGSTTSPTTGAHAIYAVRPRGPLTDVVRLFASVDAVPGILLLGASLCFSSLHVGGNASVLDGLRWLILACVLGLVLGALVHLLTMYRYNDNQLLVIILGLTIFCGGAAHYLLMSPLFVNFIVGVVVANRSPQPQRLLRSLLLLEKPFYLILLTLAGAMWSPPPLSVLALVPTFVLLRFAGKLVGGALGSRVAGLTTAGPFGVGPGLLAHGGMALVLALNVKQYFPGVLGDLAVTAAVTSILVGALVGPWALLRLLRSEGEVT